MIVERVVKYEWLWTKDDDDGEDQYSVSGGDEVSTHEEVHKGEDNFNLDFYLTYRGRTIQYSTFWDMDSRDVYVHDAIVTRKADSVFAVIDFSQIDTTRSTVMDCILFVISRINSDNHGSFITSPKDT